MKGDGVKYNGKAGRQTDQSEMVCHVTSGGADLGGAEDDDSREELAA